MSDEVFRAFMGLLMCSDPWPTTSADQKVLNEYADSIAKSKRYRDCVTA